MRLRCDVYSWFQLYITGEGHIMRAGSGKLRTKVTSLDCVDCAGEAETADVCLTFIVPKHTAIQYVC